jgi:hypothetical protein
LVPKNSNQKREMSTSDLRQKWRNYFNECDKIQNEYEKWYSKEVVRITDEWRKIRMTNRRLKLPEYPSQWSSIPPFPDELRGLT